VKEEVTVMVMVEVENDLLKLGGLSTVAEDADLAPLFLFIYY
jgi:hypothetical protein